MQSTEQHLEQQLLAKLANLKYTQRPDIRDRAALEANFREKFETLNRVQLSDAEFQRLLDGIIHPDVYHAAHTLRNINSFERDDGSPLHYTLVNLRDWCKNDFEVVSQLRINTRSSYHRYDVVLLINGVSVVQIELKTLAVSPRRAIEQIVKYKHDPGNGYGNTLLCFIQMFIVSNRSDTYYFANNNARHFSFNADERFLPVYQFAAPDNTKITHLEPFSEQFLAKCTLGQMLSRYMVLLASEQKLMVMRPYQIYAVKAIVECIQHNCGNGYIWHTTGSGKTLTSFKASTLLKDNPNIHKCLFVVDRKDLDRQTREEFNKFQHNCVEENTDTHTLVRRLLSDDYADKVIVTTIQKLGLALDTARKHNYAERLEPLRQQRMVFIFDECHRSQFGENHQAIKTFFPNAQLFGFTGTPIFDDNASQKQARQDKEQGRWHTTDDLFQRCLHQYTITHAIEDRNVLRFHVDYFKSEGKHPTPPGEGIKKSKVIDTIFAKHDAATNGRKFNALLATSSIHDAIEYFDLFHSMQSQRQQQDNTFIPLNIACVFSPPAEGNPDIQQIQDELEQEKHDNQVDPAGKKAALTRIIANYNARYGTCHRIGEFDGYYKDIQQRIKNQQFPNTDLPHAQKIDICIVVDMLLTGFDSKYLGTLYVDKNLKHHGLIQAFSRTNRVLNESKPFGNILDFRQQQDAVDKAITLFSGEKINNPRKIWLVDPAVQIIDCLHTASQKLAGFMHTQGLQYRPEEVANLKGDVARSQFINLFKEVQRLHTQLNQYTDLTEPQKAQIADITPPDTLNAFKAQYLDTARRLKEQRERQGEDAAPHVQQLDFEFILFATAIIDYDYIMAQIAQMTAEHEPEKLAMTRQKLIGLLASDAKFIDKQQDITEYVHSLPEKQTLTEAQVRNGLERFIAEKNARLLAQMAARHDIDAAALQAFVEQTLMRYVFDGEQLSELMAPLQLGWKARMHKEQALVKELAPMLHKLAEGRDISGLGVYEQ